jgi:soluble lytic murein transglycosylase-like protein
MLHIGFARSGTIEDKIVETAKQHNVDYNLALAFAEVESRFNPKASRYEPKLKTRTIGLFQILLQTARVVGFKGTASELYDTDTNILYGIKYLAKCQNLYGKSPKQIVCCYNGGWAVTDSVCRNDPNIKQYGSLVMTAIKKYKLAELN